MMKALVSVWGTSALRYLLSVSELTAKALRAGAAEGDRDEVGRDEAGRRG